MKDIQSEKDFRNIDIDKVGIKGLKYPILLLDKAHKKQHTVATINMYVNLPKEFRATHMSRFIEIINSFHREIAISNIGKILRTMKERLNARSAHLELEFPYFIEKKAPVSLEKGLVEYQCQFIGNLEEKVTLFMGVKIPGLTVCPCSKELSPNGAHNQWAILKVLVRFKGFLWLEDLIELIENSTSSPVYSLLKREDEKFIVEKAFENPRFVEDVVRDVALKLESHPLITWYSIECESFESIHNHNAYAYLEKKEKEKYKEEFKGI
uniref:GTP cyclohydrolase FolE2 n=1 Tax=candidate division WOR-3 bacterium TaxID=2052148 RepID=A0A7V5XZX1_UNCW3